MNSSMVTVDGVIGDGPFIHIGTPTAIDTSPDLVVVGGNLGWAQWNGRSVYDRSDRSVGWFPIGIYRGEDLVCLRVLTSRWEINAVAIHPDGRMIAIGTGAYDGGYAFEGELLLHNLETGTTTTLLKGHRMVERLEWLDGQTLALVAAPSTDEDVDWPHIVFEAYTLRTSSWLNVDRKAIDLDAESSRPAEAVQRDPSVLRDELRDLSERSGLAFHERRHAWALAPAADGAVVVGLESAIERWENERDLVWRRSLDGTCTQLMSPGKEKVVAGVWQSPDSEFLKRPTTLMQLDHQSGAIGHTTELGHPCVLIGRADGGVLARDTQHGRAAGHPAAAFSAAGERMGEIALSVYDLVNHYFDIRRAPDFLVLLGDDPESWKEKRVAKVHRGVLGRWAKRDLFPLAWAGQRHVQGGPGVYVDDTLGRAVVHSGIVHDFAGLQRGNAFVVRRRYPGGQVDWHVGLDNQITAIDESEGRIVVVTNLGELVVIDAESGDILGREEKVAIDGHAVVPLSLALEARGRAWIGTLDGRVIRATLSH